MERFNQTVRVVRLYGSWSAKGAVREMTLLEMVNWMNKHGYKLANARDRKDGKRNLTFQKPGCNTEYYVVC